MSILSLRHIGELADTKTPSEPTLLDRLFAALYRARMAQAERIVEQYCPSAFDRRRRPDATDCRPFRID